MKVTVPDIALNSLWGTKMYKSFLLSFPQETWSSEENPTCAKITIIIIPSAY